MNDKQYNMFLDTVEEMKSCELKRYECSCPVEMDGKGELFFCRHLVETSKKEMCYQSGKGYHEHYVEKKLCTHKWMKEMGLREEPNRVETTELTTESGGIEDLFGEGGLGLK